jgi:hypothetical protein
MVKARSDRMTYLRFYSTVLPAHILYIFPALLYTDGWNCGKWKGVVYRILLHGSLI